MTLLDTRTLAVARPASPDRLEADGAAVAAAVALAPAVAAPAILPPTATVPRPHHDHDPATCGPGCGHDHVHHHDQDHGHDHPHRHAHGPHVAALVAVGASGSRSAAPVDGAVVRIVPSLLRLGLGGRLAGAALLSGALWTMILQVTG